ncbi:hypothetical protein TRFO_19458 [Tritrichomonas foetus]|uniref:Uncharacterized protein n=1 Tax=Tritrichomonas foetus TaxID=1144522 RepID=A0A1J4KIY6_9EUKA|nr:hypothetical protein TRFO_19458 [Tritrichomonas foetus]|eukprot:OHT11050.1 hypothetical protein TRFO_19458 [Tritrichomonas foetus]
MNETFQGKERNPHADPPTNQSQNHDYKQSYFTRNNESPNIQKNHFHSSINDFIFQLKSDHFDSLASPENSKQWITKLVGLLQNIDESYSQKLNEINLLNQKLNKKEFESQPLQEKKIKNLQNEILQLKSKIDETQQKQNENIQKLTLKNVQYGKSFSLIKDIVENFPNELNDFDEFIQILKDIQLDTNINSQIVTPFLNKITNWKSALEKALKNNSMGSIQKVDIQKVGNLKTDHKIIEQAQYFVDIKNAISDHFTGDDWQIPEYVINSLPHQNNSAFSNEVTHRLFILLENHVNFLSKLISSNQIDILTLQNNNQDNSLCELTELKGKIFTELAKTRQFMLQNNSYSNLNGDNEFDLSKISKISDDRELFDILATIIFQSRVIQEYSLKLKEQSTQNMKIIQEIIDNTQYTGDVCDLPDCIVNNLISLSEVIDDIKNLTGITNTDSLHEFIEKIVNDMHQINEDIKNNFNVDEEIIDLPKFFHILIKKYKEIEKFISENQNKRIENKNLLKELKFIKHEKTNLELQISELRHNENNLIKKYENSLENNNNLQQELINIRSEIETLQNEKKTMLEKIEKNEEQFNQKLKQAVNEEKKQCVQKLEEKYNKKLEAILEEKEMEYSHEMEYLKKDQTKNDGRNEEIIHSLKLKHQATNNKLKKMMESYNDAFMKQKEAVTVIKSHNEKLAKELTKVKAHEIELNNRIECLTSEKSQFEINFSSKIQKLHEENEELTEKVNKLTKRCEQIQIVRDNYWESQFSLKEVNFRVRESLLIKTQNEFLQKVISLVSFYAPKPIDITEEYVFIALNSILTKIQNNEELISHLRSKLLEKSSINDLRHQNDEKFEEEKKKWEKWGREMYSTVIETEASKYSSNDLRFILGEMIFSSINQRKVFQKLESLRFQKKILNENFSTNRLNEKSYTDRKSRYFSFRNVVIAVVATRKCVLKNQKLPFLSLKPLLPP